MGGVGKERLERAEREVAIGIEALLEGAKEILLSSGESEFGWARVDCSASGDEMN